MYGTKFCHPLCDLCATLPNFKNTPQDGYTVRSEQMCLRSLLHSQAFGFSENLQMACCKTTSKTSLAKYVIVVA